MEFYTLKETKKELRCTRQHIDWLHREGVLKKYKPKVGPVQFNKDEIDKLSKPNPVEKD